MRRRIVLAAAAAAAGVVVVGGVRDAAACGSLVAPNGAVRLERASTLAAWHDGVEHYLTSFAYQGDVADIGWIVPLPAVPDSVVKGGSWALQRLAREARPVREELAFAGDAAPAAASAEVVLTTTVDSLDITVLKGSGQAVLDWCAANSFELNDETRAHILSYAQGSPIFLAARYDTSAARARGFARGDGTPVLITMRTPHLWVPLEVLANADDPLSADVFLLTDSRPALDLRGDGVELDGAPGFRVIRQETIPAQLHDDLARQPNMDWVPAAGWFTAMTLESSGATVTYDLTVASSRLVLSPMGMGPSAVDRAGAAEPEAIGLGVGADGRPELVTGQGRMGTGVAVAVALGSLAAAGLAGGLAVLVTARVEARRRRAA